MSIRWMDVGESRRATDKPMTVKLETRARQDKKQRKREQTSCFPGWFQLVPRYCTVCLALCRELPKWRVVWAVG